MNGIEPNVGKLLVKIDTEEEKTRGGLFIPGSVDRNDGPKRGVVVAAGPARKVEGTISSLIFCTGDRVIVDILGGTKLKVEGVDLVLVRAEDILARVAP